MDAKSCPRSFIYCLPRQACSPQGSIPQAFRLNADLLAWPILIAFTFRHRCVFFTSLKSESLATEFIVLF